MNLSIISNLDNVPAVQNFLKQQEVYNNASSPLSEAQRRANELMALKKRIPMVIEYYQKPNELVSVEMYINPERLQMQTAKIKDKAVTRGGIFYHHWGDDDWKMQLSGTVGLSGMKGIEQLEKIYHHSGTLLKYQNVGPDAINTTIELPEIDLNNPFAGIDFVISNNVNDSTLDRIIRNQEAKQQELNQTNFSDQLLLSQQKDNELGAVMLNDYKNITTSAKSINNYNNIKLEISHFIQDQMDKGKPVSYEIVSQETHKKIKKHFSDSHASIQNKITENIATEATNAHDVTNPNGLLSGQSLNEVDNYITDNSERIYEDDQIQNNSIMDRQIDLLNAQVDQFEKNVAELQDYIQKKTSNTKKVAMTAWQDIQDELDDEWRPRQVFIYFDDRVYIGHFNSFSWNRVAETPLIKYEMSLTIIRQIIVTTNNQDSKPKISQNITNSSQSGQQNIQTLSNTPENRSSSGNEENNELDDIQKFGPILIMSYKESALIDMFKLKEGLISDHSADNIVKVIKNINSINADIREKLNIPYNDAILGTQEMNWMQRLDFYSKSKIEPQNEYDSKLKQHAISAAGAYFNAMNQYYNKNKDTPVWTTEKKQKVVENILEVENASGIKFEYFDEIKESDTYNN